MNGNKNKFNIICTSCPVGCRLTVFEDANGDIEVEGNVCKRGRDYAVSEFSDPKRMVTSSACIMGGSFNMVSVKTDAPINKDLVGQALKAIRSIKTHAPVEIGDVLYPDVGGSGVNIVATRKVEQINANKKAAV